METEHFINIHALSFAENDAGQVAGGTDCGFVIFRHRQQNGTFHDFESVEDSLGTLGLVIGQIEFVDNDDIAVNDAFGKGTTESQSHDLLVDFLGVAAGFGSEDNTTAQPNRTAAGTCTGTAGTFLTEGFCTAAGDFAASFGAGSTCTHFSEESDNSVTDGLFAFFHFQSSIGNNVFAYASTLAIKYIQSF